MFGIIRHCTQHCRFSEVILEFSVDWNILQIILQHWHKNLQKCVD